MHWPPAPFNLVSAVDYLIEGDTGLICASYPFADVAAVAEISGRGEACPGFEGFVPAEFTGMDVFREYVRIAYLLCIIVFICYVRLEVPDPGTVGPV